MIDRQRVIGEVREAAENPRNDLVYARTSLVRDVLGLLEEKTDLAVVLAAESDLDQAKRALVREATIRHAMAETGEDRETITDMIDAMQSMGQEAVLDLAEGEPTTMAGALERYVDTLEQSASEDETVRAEDVCGALSALLAYPWPCLPPD